MTAVLAAYAAGQATEHAALTAVAAGRLLVPVVAVPVEPGARPADATAPPHAGQPQAADRDAGSSHARDRHGGAGGEQETEMALPTLIGNDGRKAVIAFTGIETISRWRADARPVPVPAARLWPAAAAEQADAVVIDVAGPVALVIEGARLATLAGGAPPPPPHLDPDVRAQVAAITPDFTLQGGPERSRRRPSRSLPPIRQAPAPPPRRSQPASPRGCAAASRSALALAPARRQRESVLDHLLSVRRERRQRARPHRRGLAQAEPPLPVG